MRKETYLSSLIDILDMFEISEEEKSAILENYEGMIEDAIREGNNDVDLESLFGDRHQVKKQLEKIYPKKRTIRRTEIINRAMPFITLAIFVLLGVLYDAWHPAWMVFLLIPVSAILLEVINSESIKKTYSLIPVLTLMLYLVLGFFYSLWHPGWLVLTLGIMAIILYSPSLPLLPKLTAVSPFLALNVFILVGHFTGAYSPTWTVFFLVIFIGILNENRIHHKWMLEGFLVLSILVYLILGFYLEDWTLALFSFLIFIIPAIFTGHIHVKIHGFSTWVEKTTLLLSIIVFFLWGYFLDAWAVAWVVFLTVPSMSVILHAKGRDSLVPITVFLSILAFYLIGYYTGYWNLAWLVFLSIPVVAIVQEV
ncbi:MAG: hypothetical protein ACOCSM_00705 [Bacillota bacterium]